jgi:chromosome segregation ATPase
VFVILFVLFQLQKQQQSKQRILKCHIEPGNQTQEYFFGLHIAEGSNRQTVDELIEKQKQLQATIDNQTKTEETCKRTIQELVDEKIRLLDIIDNHTKANESNNLTIQELLEKQKQLQTNISGQIKTVETMKQWICEQEKDVSTRKVEAITTSKWAEIPPAVNIANVRPNNVCF